MRIDYPRARYDGVRRYLPSFRQWLLLAGVGVLTPPFEAARSALLADVMSGEDYVAANALMNLLAQAAQVLVVVRDHAAQVAGVAAAQVGCAAVGAAAPSRPS